MNHAAGGRGDVVCRCYTRPPRPRLGTAISASTGRGAIFGDATSGPEKLGRSVSHTGEQVSESSPARQAAIRSAAAAVVPRLVSLTAKIAAIPAPTGDERERSQAVAAMFQEIGLPVQVDHLGDVVATIAGDGSHPPVILASHLDTVFAKETPLNVQCSGDRLHGPGVGDNSLSVAALVVLPEVIASVASGGRGDILLVANVGEEGLGNLRGMRAVMDAYPTTAAAVAVEGHNLGRLTNIAVGSRRLRVTATGPGGHSWGDFGRPSAIHALSHLIADLDALPLDRSPKTTLNVGTISGGVSVNSIAPTASCLIDMRSIDSRALGRIGDRVDRVIECASRRGITVAAELLGERPAGIVSLESPIVRIATEILASLGIDAGYDASSTDANIPISRGIPAVCVGLTTGGNVHREDEYIDLGPIERGVSQLALLALALAEGGANSR